MPTRADLDATEARPAGRDPAAELALLRVRLAECYAVIDATARLHCPCTVREAARLLLAAHGRPGWAGKGVSDV